MKLRTILPPRFGLRSLFVVGIVCCLICGWVGRGLYRVRREDAALETLKRVESIIYLKFGEDSRRLLEEPTVPENRSFSSRLQDDASRAVGWSKRPPIDAVDLYLDSPDSQANRDAIAALVWLPEIKEVSFSGGAFDDTSLESVARMQSLERLCLSHTSVSDTGLAKLAGNDRLKILITANHAPNRRILASVSALKELRLVVVSTQSTTKEEVAAVAALPRLEELQLEEPADAEVLTPLANSRSILRLWIRSVDRDRFEAAELAAIARMPRLEFLSISRMDRADLSPLLLAPKLKQLILYDSVPHEAARRFSAKLPACEVHCEEPYGGSEYFLAGRPFEPAPWVGP